MTDFRLVFKEDTGLVDRHIQYIGNIFPFVSDFERLPIIAFSLADIAGNINVRQEMHFDLDQAVAGTGLTTSPFDIKGKASLPVASKLGVLRRGKQIPDIVENAGICCRIGARRPSDRALIQLDHLIHIFQPFNTVTFSGTGFCPVLLGRKSFIQDLVDQ